MLISGKVLGIKAAYALPVKMGDPAPTIPRSADKAGALLWVARKLGPGMAAAMGQVGDFSVSWGGSGYMRQPVFSYDHSGVSRAGDRDPATVNVLGKLRAAGVDVEAFKAKYPEGTPIPGTQYVTIVMDYDIASGKFIIRGIVFTFAPKWQDLLDEFPKKPVCPPGTEGPPPDCKKPEPPQDQPPSPSCPPPWPDGTRWIPDENGICRIWVPPAGCPTCLPYTGNLKFELFR